MPLEFPYQIVTFLAQEPSVGEPVYYGEHGWYPQIALKRRFKLSGIDEAALDEKLRTHFSSIAPFTVNALSLTRPETMPVDAIEIAQTPKLMAFHQGLIVMLGDDIISRYPERDGVNYYPHITAEYNDQPVINSEEFEQRDFVIKAIWLLKDADDENSRAHIRYPLQRL